MKSLIPRMVPIIALALITVMLLPTGQNVQTAQAGVWGPVEILNQSCSSVTVRFYFDGLAARDLYRTDLSRDQFRLQVWNRLCPDGSPCSYKITEVWQDVPEAFGYITMTATWPVVTNGNRIEVRIGQYDLDVDAPLYADPPSVVDRDYAGVEISESFSCTGGTAATATTTVQPVQLAQPVQPAQPAVSYPEGFLFQCTAGGGVRVISGNLVVIEADPSHIAGPLTTALSTGQNQPVMYGNGVSLWALKSNELQVHADSDPDATKVVIKANACGPITTQTTNVPVYQPTHQQASYTYTGPPATGGTVHVVQPGENLFRISLRYGRTMQAIAAANGIVNYNRIYAGQQLIIP
jgi:LysM repeat protein